jgi:hypothetical protein
VNTKKGREEGTDIFHEEGLALRLLLLGEIFDSEIDILKIGRARAIDLRRRKMSRGC